MIFGASGAVVAIAAAAAGAALAGLMAGLYYNKAEDALEEFEILLDKQIDFMWEMHDFKMNLDIPMVYDKLDVLTQLYIPMSTSINQFTVQWMQGNVYRTVGGKHEMLFREHSMDTNDYLRHWEGGVTRIGAPQTELAHNQQFRTMSQAEERRAENFIANKTKLVRNAQSSASVVTGASTIYNKYSQAATIFNNLSSMYIQGFNSAGASVASASGSLIKAIESKQKADDKEDKAGTKPKGDD